ncbi:hypothetical protein [Pseudoxanthomonas sp. SGT-18]|uniref:hypothetical protein n=1 Tax=Pseudoxanthomonas sp. SGT-18 TaxID=2493087 RepID=UPI000F629DDB|nr:hypothetical protein [Pseudoxanthomonas sp. SGT-18]
MNRILVAIVIFVAWTAAAFAAGWAWRGDRAEASEAAAQRNDAKAEARAQQGARVAEQATAEALSDIGTELEEERSSAETLPAAVAADLRAGNLRLRREWAGCETQRMSDAAAAAVERDALAASREDLAGALVRVGRDADDQLRACQAVILAYREGVTP